jgi:hypothetical protein
LDEPSDVVILAKKGLLDLELTMYIVQVTGGLKGVVPQAKE